MQKEASFRSFVWCLVLILSSYHQAEANSLSAAQLFIKSTVPELCTVQGLEDLLISNTSIATDGTLSGSSNLGFKVNCTKINGDFATYQVSVTCNNNDFVLVNQSDPSSQINYQIRFSSSQDAYDGEILLHGQPTARSYVSGALGNTQDNASLHIELLGANGGVSSGEYSDNCSLTLTNN